MKIHIYKQKLFNTLILTTYFKYVEINEIIYVINNYQNLSLIKTPKNLLVHKMIKKKSFCLVQCNCSYLRLDWQ